MAGGVILVVAGMIEFAGGNASAYVSSPLSLTRAQEGILGIVAGVIALSGYRQLHLTAWSVLMLVLGIVAGGLGGILILVSGLVSLVVVHAEKAVSLQR